MCFLIRGNSAVVLLLSLLMKCFVVSLCVLRGALRSLILIGVVSGACLERRQCEMPDRVNCSDWPLSAHCSNYNKHSSGSPMFCFPNVCLCVSCLCSTMVRPECFLEGFVVQCAHAKTPRPSDMRIALWMIISHHLLFCVFCISTHTFFSYKIPYSLHVSLLKTCRMRLFRCLLISNSFALRFSFFCSLELKCIVQLDLDLKFRSNVRDLFQEFNHFPSKAVIGIAREMQPVYRYLTQLYLQSFDWVHSNLYATY